MPKKTGHKKTTAKKATKKKVRPSTRAARERLTKVNARRRKARDAAMAARKAPRKLKSDIRKATEQALGIVRDTHNKIVLSQDTLPTVIEMAARGVREEDISLALGISKPTWQRIKKDQPEFDHALTAGRGIEHDKIRGVVYDRCIRGDRRACVFLLKTQFGYREGGTDVEIVQNNIKITLPGALDRESYKKIIECSSTVVTEDADND